MSIHMISLKLFFIIIVGFFFTFTYSVSAQMSESTTSADLSGSEAAELGYTLPYPGLLPDHPLYFLKTARDRIVSLLINDPLKKAEFNLLTSDKRLNSALMVFSRNKQETALETISKSNNYFHEAVTALEKARRAGKDIKPLRERMESSIKTHIFLMNNVKNKVDKKNIQIYQDELKRMNDLKKFLKNTSL